jgi:hypothetical protein
LDPAIDFVKNTHPTKIQAVDSKCSATLGSGERPAFLLFTHEDASEDNALLMQTYLLHRRLEKDGIDRHFVLGSLFTSPQVKREIIWG